MNDQNVFVGIDYHKRYSVISAVGASGVRLLESRRKGSMFSPPGTSPCPYV